LDFSWRGNGRVGRLVIAGIERVAIAAGCAGFERHFFSKLNSQKAMGARLGLVHIEAVNHDALARGNQSTGDRERADIGTWRFRGELILIAIAVHADFRRLVIGAANELLHADKERGVAIIRRGIESAADLQDMATESRLAIFPLLV